MSIALAPPLAAPASAYSGVLVVLPEVASWEALTDAEVTSLVEIAGDARRSVDAFAIAAAAELSRRSSRAAGQSGLAARLGARSVERAVQRLAGVGFSEAKSITGAGVALDSSATWLAPVADGLREGGLSAAEAAAISAGLGSPSDSVTAEELLGAATELVQIARQTTPEETAKAARAVRDLLDDDGIDSRHERLREKRALKWWVQVDGTVRVAGVLDPESGAIFMSMMDAATAPRRGGPRFVDAGGRRGAAGVGSDGGTAGSVDSVASADTRTTEQFALDTFIDILQLATRAGSTAIDVATLFATQNPGVRVHVTSETLRKGSGPVFLEGQSALVPASTAERIICTDGVVPIVFDRRGIEGGSSIDVARSQRLHSVKQRIALAARWGGCAWLHCDRPPAMTEVHHLEGFNGHNTTTDNGIPLCRFHHMQLHASGWRIRHERPTGEYLLIPPGAVDPAQTPRSLRSKNPLRREQMRL